MKYTVIDSSGYSMLDFDYNALKASGVDGVILRAGYGSAASQRDPAFEEAYQRAEAAGLPIGVYWFNYFRDEDDARAEAEAFNEVIQGKHFELGLYLDYEEDTIDYMDRCGGNKDDMTGRLVAAIEHMISLGWEKVRWYANPHCINGAHGADALDLDRLAPYGLWLAKFDGVPEDVGSWGAVTVVGKQFANNNMKPVNLEWLPNVDVSVFYLDDIDISTDDNNTTWTDEQARGVVSRLYEGLLRRGYGYGENEGLIEALKGTMTRIEAFESIINSEEYQKKRLIRDCYLVMRGCEPSSEELHDWFQQDEDTIKRGILYSNEFNNNYGV